MFEFHFSIVPLVLFRDVNVLFSLVAAVLPCLDFGDLSDLSPLHPTGLADLHLASSSGANLVEAHFLSDLPGCCTGPANLLFLLLIRS